MPTPIAAKDLRGTVDDLTGWFLALGLLTLFLASGAALVWSQGLP